MFEEEDTTKTALMQLFQTYIDNPELIDKLSPETQNQMKQMGIFPKKGLLGRFKAKKHVKRAALSHIQKSFHTTETVQLPVKRLDFGKLSSKNVETTPKTKNLKKSCQTPGSTLNYFSTPQKQLKDSAHPTTPLMNRNAELDSFNFQIKSARQTRPLVFNDYYEQLASPALRRKTQLDHIMEDKILSNDEKIDNIYKLASEIICDYSDKCVWASNIPFRSGETTFRPPAPSEPAPQYVGSKSTIVEIKKQAENPVKHKSHPLPNQKAHSISTPKSKKNILDQTIYDENTFVGSSSGSKLLHFSPMMTKKNKNKLFSTQDQSPRFGLKNSASPLQLRM